MHIIAHFKNSVTHIRTLAQPMRLLCTRLLKCTQTTISWNGPITVRYSGDVASEPIAKRSEFLELQSAHLWQKFQNWNRCEIFWTFFVCDAAKDRHQDQEPVPKSELVNRLRPIWPAEIWTSDLPLQRRKRYRSINCLVCSKNIASNIRCVD